MQRADLPPAAARHREKTAGRHVPLFETLAVPQPYLSAGAALEGELRHARAQARRRVGSTGQDAAIARTLLHAAIAGQPHAIATGQQRGLRRRARRHTGRPHLPALPTPAQRIDPGQPRRREDPHHALRIFNHHVAIGTCWILCIGPPRGGEALLRRETGERAAACPPCVCVCRRGQAACRTGDGSGRCGETLEVPPLGAESPYALAASRQPDPPLPVLERLPDARHLAPVRPGQLECVVVPAVLILPPHLVAIAEPVPATPRRAEPTGRCAMPGNGLQGRQLPHPRTLGRAGMQPPLRIQAERDHRPSGSAEHRRRLEPVVLPPRQPGGTADPQAAVRIGHEPLHPCRRQTTTASGRQVLTQEVIAVEPEQTGIAGTKPDAAVVHGLDRQDRAGRHRGYRRPRPPGELLAVSGKTLQITVAGADP